MKVLVATPPAYIGNHDRHFLTSVRWSHSLQIPKKSGCKDHYFAYPFFIGYSSALLKRDTDVQIKAVDACALDFDEKEFTNYVEKYSPDLLVVEVPTVSFPLVMDLLGEIRGCVGKIAVGGGHITALTSEVMRSYRFIDYALIGEYEITLKELVEHESMDKVDREDLKLIKGIAFRDDKNVVVNKRRELLKDLDFLPFPDRDDLRVENYRDFEISGRPCIQVLSSRGCPFSCAFCLRRQVIYSSPLYRKRDPAKVVDEMELCKEKHGAKQIYFDDDTMTVDRRYLREICEEILVRGFDIPWASMGDITLDRETLELMRKAGCVGLKFGVETTDIETLEKSGKGFVKTEKVKQFREWCRELDIWTHATYMVGLPGDTEEKIKATLRFAKKLDTESAQFSIATPLPGTPFFSQAKEKGWLRTLDWTRYDGNNYSVLNYPSLSKENIEDLYRYMCDSWRKHKIKCYLMHPLKTLKRIKSIGLGRAVRGTLKILKIGSTI